MKLTLKEQLQRPSYRHRVLKRIEEILDRGDFIEGLEVKLLQRKMENFTKRGYAIATSSGTDALVLALKAIGAKRVAVPAFSFIASASSIVLAGAEPVFVDIRPDTWTIDTDQIPSDVDTVLTVDIFGVPADYKKLLDRRVIVDAAQSLGGFWNGVPCGKFGDIAITSFYPTKAIGAYGDAGMLFTDNFKYAQAVKQLKNHGEVGKYNHVVIGGNCRMDTLQAAVLLEKLTLYHFELGLRQEAYRDYHTRLNSVFFQVVPDEVMTNCSYFPILLGSNNERDKLYAKIDHAVINYPLPMPLQPCFKDGKRYPVAEDICRKVLCLPISAYMTVEQREEVIEIVNNAT